MNIRKNDNRKGILAIVAIFLFAFEIYRISNYCITWDEGYTYYGFVRPIFRGEDRYGIMHMVWEYFFHPGVSSANNHWLNTLLIGILDRITGIQYNEYVIRFPVFCFFVIYIGGIFWAYCQKYISFSEAYMLMLSYYVDEFFVLARGYAFSLTLLFIGIYEIKKWGSTNEMKHLLRAIIAFTFAEVANTIALLSVASLYFLIFFVLIKSKLLLDFIHRYWLALSGLAVVNILMIRYHFKAAKADGGLYCNEKGSILSILKEYMGFLSPNFERGLLLFYIAITVVGIALILHSKDKIGSFYFIGVWILYLLITYVGVKAWGKGFPTGRELIPAYALFIVSMQEMICIVSCKLKDKTKNIFSMIGCILLCISFIGQVDLKGTRDWGDYAEVKKDAYHIWEMQEKVDRQDDRYRSAGTQFYRNKILLECGYDIFLEEE